MMGNGIGKQEKRKEPGFGGKKGSCDVGIPAKEVEHTTVFISCSGFCVFHVSTLFCEENPIGWPGLVTKSDLYMGYGMGVIEFTSRYKTKLEADSI